MTPEILRGTTHIIDFDLSKGMQFKISSEILKRRPTVVLLRNATHRVRRGVMVLRLSSAPAPMEIFTVAVPSAGVGSVAVSDQLTAINKTTRVLNRVGLLSAAGLRAVELGVLNALDLR